MRAMNSRSCLSTKPGWGHLTCRRLVGWLYASGCPYPVARTLVGTNWITANLYKGGGVLINYYPLGARIYSCPYPFSWNDKKERVFRAIQATIAFNCTNTYPDYL